MQVFTLWHEGDDGEVPWLIDAVDQYTIYNSCAFPPPYLKHRTNAHVHELVIDIPEDAVRALFSAPNVRGTVVKDGARTGQNALDGSNELLLTAREFGYGNARAGDVAAAAYRLAAAKLRAWGAWGAWGDGSVQDEQHAKDLESAAEQVERIP